MPAAETASSVFLAAGENLAKDLLAGWAHAYQ